MPGRDGHAVDADDPVADGETLRPAFVRGVSRAESLPCHIADEVVRVVGAVGVVGEDADRGHPGWFGIGSARNVQPRAVGEFKAARHEEEVEVAVAAGVAQAGERVVERHLGVGRDDVLAQ